MATEHVKKSAVQDSTVKGATIQPQAVGSQVAEVMPDSLGQTTGQTTGQTLTVAIIGLLLALGLAIWGISVTRTVDPYIQSVLQLTGDVSRGRDIFLLNCATCHGLEAAGEVGPDLHDVSARKSRVALIEQVISGQTPPMPQFQPNKKDMADLLSFLETL